MFLPLIGLGSPVHGLLTVPCAGGIARTGVRNASGEDEYESCHSKLMFRGHGTLRFARECTRNRFSEPKFLFFGFGTRRFDREIIGNFF